MKKHNFQVGALCLALATVSLPALADDYSFLTFQYGGVQQSVALTSLKKITFSGGKMLATTADGVHSFDLNTMEKMFFSATATALTTTTADCIGLVYDAASQTVRVGGNTGGAMLNVYFLNGSLALRTPVAAEGASVSLASLPKGVYVVKLNGQTLKITR